MKDNGRKPMADKPATTDKPSKLQKALDFKAKYEELIKAAEEEAKQQINEAVESLRELGIVYHVLPDDEYRKLATKPAATKQATKQAAKPKEVAGPSVNYNAEKFCNTCKENGHDGRLHRTRKNKFSNEEMAELGVLPPDLAPKQPTLQ